MIESAESPRWLRVSEAKDLLNVSDSTVRRWLTDGRLTGWREGGVVRVDKVSINRFIEAHPYKATSPNGRSLALGRWRRSLRRRTS